MHNCIYLQAYSKMSYFIVETTGVGKFHTRKIPTAAHSNCLSNLGVTHPHPSCSYVLNPQILLWELKPLWLWPYQKIWMLLLNFRVYWSKQSSSAVCINDWQCAKKSNSSLLLPQQFTRHNTTSQLILDNTEKATFSMQQHCIITQWSSLNNRE